MSRHHKMLASLAVLGVMAFAGGAGTFAAFSATSQNENNTFAAGTVTLADNDAGEAMLALTNAVPGDTSVGCIIVVLTGSLSSHVRLYGAVVGGLAPYLQLRVERGTQEGAPAGDCTGFTADTTDYVGSGPGVLYDDLASRYPTTWAEGIADPTATWASGEAHAYRFTATLLDDNEAQGQSATATFMWEAHNA